MKRVLGLFLSIVAMLAISVPASAVSQGVCDRDYDPDGSGYIDVCVTVVDTGCYAYAKLEVTASSTASIERVWTGYVEVKDYNGEIGRTSDHVDYPSDGTGLSSSIYTADASNHKAYYGINVDWAATSAYTKYDDTGWAPTNGCNKS